MSLTSVPCKILDHIICSHVRDHLDRHNILSTLQHGFRERHSCESQLLTTLQDLLSLHDRGVQVDLVVLYFAKAFDTVPHESLLGKLKHYGIDSNINQWVRAFLTNSLYAWGQRWGMFFNVEKCNVMRITRSRSPITKFYTLGGQILEQVNQAKYLGVMLSVSWIGTVNDSQKHGSRAGEASKTTGSGYRSALAAGCSLLTALYIRT